MVAKLSQFAIVHVLGDVGHQVNVAVLGKELHGGLEHANGIIVVTLGRVPRQARICLRHEIRISVWVGERRREGGFGAFALASARAGRWVIYHRRQIHFV